MADNKIQVLLTVDDQGTASLQKFGRTVAKTGKDGTKSFLDMEAASDRLSKRVVQLASAYASIQSVRALISIADQYTNLEGRLRLVTSSTAELAAVETQLYAVAQQTRVGYAETVELYTRLARATKETGISQTELMSTVQAVNQALIVSGATTTEANAALIQFSQGMASGVLRGEELNSVMEQTPRIAQMIADGLGISLGQLRAWGKEGKLTSDVVMPALLRSAEDVNREFGLMPTTVAQAGTVLANTLKSLVADANSGSGATAELAAAIIGVSTAVDANREELVAMFADMANGAINAAREAGKLVPVINSIYTASSQLLGLSAGEWGIIGFALLRGGPQAAALAGALLIINGALDELGLGLKSLGAAWKGYAESMQNMGDVLSGKRDWQTGEWIDQQSTKIGDLETKLATLQQQAAATGDTFSTGFEVGVSAAAEESDKLNAEIAETQSQLDAARTASASFQKGIKSASIDVNDLSNFTDELSVSTGKLSGEMGTLESKTGAAAKAVKAAAKEKKEAEKASRAAAKAEREAIAQVAVAMRNYANAAETGTKATEQWAKGATDAAEAMADLGEHYATAGLSEYDALMVKLNREFTEGQSAIRAYDTSMAESNSKVATASKEYEAAEAKLAEYRKQLDGTSLSAEQLQAKLGTAAGVVEKKREALDAAEAAARKLETANGGVAATEEDLRKRIFETNESLDQQRQAYIDAATKGDDFFAGVAAGALEMQDSMMTLGRVGYEVFNELREGWRDSFFAVMSGDLDDLGDIWDSTLQAMLRAFTDFIADLVMAWAAAGIADMFGFKIPGFGGGVGSIGSAIGASLGSGSGAANTWLGAAGYQPGASTGWTSYAGPALATAGGAYALYDAASKAGKGEMNAGTAIEAAGGAYLAYTGGSALLGKLGTTAAPIIQDMVLPASSEIMIAASDLTLLGPQTGGLGNAIAGGGAGAAVGPMAATAGALALWGGIAYGINKLGSTPTQQAVEWDQLNNYGTWGRDRGSYRSDQRPGWETSGSGDAEMQSWGTIDSTASHYGFDVLEGEILSFAEAAKQSLADLTDNMGQQWADLAAGLEDSVPAYDAYLDAIMGVDVAMEQSADIHRLAQQAAADNGASLVHLTNALKAMGMSDEMARASAVALVAAVDQQQAASVSAASAAQSMASAVADFSNTPLNIRVNVGVREQPYRIDNSNPYAEHAAGGIFAGPTLIPSIRGTRHLVGEAGAEAIMPLHAGPGTLKAMHEDIKSLAGRPVNLTINLDGQQIARTTLPTIDAHLAAKATRGQTAIRTRF